MDAKLVRDAVHASIDREEAYKAALLQMSGVTWPRNNDAQMMELIKLFPALRGFHGKHWDVVAFMAWAFDNCCARSENCAARFVLSVWNSSTKYDEQADWLKERGIEIKKAACKRFFRRFDLYEAVQCWDHGNRLAFVIFCANPFWP